MRRLSSVVCPAVLSSTVVVGTTAPGNAKAALTIGVGTQGGCVLAAGTQVWCWGPLPSRVAGFPEGVAVLETFDSQTWCAVANW